MEESSFIFVPFLYYSFTVYHIRAKKQAGIRKIKIPKREEICKNRIENSEMGKYLDKKGQMCYTEHKKRRKAA